MKKFNYVLTYILLILSILIALGSAFFIGYSIFKFKKFLLILLFIATTIIFTVLSNYYLKFITILKKQITNIAYINKIESAASLISILMLIAFFSLSAVPIYFLLVFRAFKLFNLIFITIALLTAIYSFNTNRLMKDFVVIKKELRKNK
jgi:hypothetical protein